MSIKSIDLIQPTLAIRIRSTGDINRYHPRDVQLSA